MDSQKPRMRPFVFQKLPPEIRNQIYQYVLQPAYDGCPSQTRNRDRGIKGCTNVLRLCHQIYAESLPVLLEAPKTLLYDAKNLKSIYRYGSSGKLVYVPISEHRNESVKRLAIAIDLGAKYEHCTSFMLEDLKLFVLALREEFNRSKELTSCHVHIDTPGFFFGTPSQLRTTLSPLVNWRSEDTRFTLCVHGFWSKHKYLRMNIDVNAEWLERWFLKARENAEQAAGNPNRTVRKFKRSEFSVIRYDESKKTDLPPRTTANQERTSLTLQ